MTDDALITFRYAENLARGDGLVYNPGERVYGTTTPLYAVVLAGFTGLGIRLWHASAALDVLFLAGLCWVFWGYSRRLGDRIWPWFFFPLLFIDPFKFLPPAGMESALLSLLVYGAFLAQAQGKRKLAVLTAAVSGFVRPEGFLALALLWPDSVICLRGQRLRPGWLRAILAGALPLAAGFAILFLFYGRLFPQTIEAKAFQGHSTETWEPWIYVFARGLLQDSGVGLALVEWFGVGLMIVRHPCLRFVGLWYIAYPCLMLIGHAPDYNWYTTPIQPARAAALATGLVFLGRMGAEITERAFRVIRNGSVALRRAMSGASLEFPRTIRTTLVVAVAAGILVGFGRPYLAIMGKVYRWLYTLHQPWFDCRSYEKAGPWIREHSRQADEVVAPEIGYLGYFSKRRVFDPMGLVSPEALKRLTHNGHRSGGYRDPWTWALIRRSRFVVGCLSNDVFTSLPREFCRWYAIEAAFPNRDRTTTLVFVRRGSPIEDEAKAGWLPGKEIGVYPRRDANVYTSWPPD